MTSIFAWKLLQTEDLFGNRIQYEYDRDNGPGWSPPMGSALSKTYSICRLLETPEQPEFLVEVTFEYEDRPDPFSDISVGL